MLDVTTISSGGVCCAPTDEAANAEPTAASEPTTLRVFFLAFFIALASLNLRAVSKRGTKAWQPCHDAPAQRTPADRSEPTCSAGLLADRYDPPRLPEVQASVASRSDSLAANSCGGSSGFEA